MFGAVSGLATILDVIRDGGDTAFADLRGETERRSSPEMWTDASVGWYATTAKLDLEARGLVARVPGSKRQHLCLVV